jgi:hypothetical protein
MFNFAEKPPLRGHDGERDRQSRKTAPEGDYRDDAGDDQAVANYPGGCDFFRGGSGYQILTPGGTVLPGLAGSFSAVPRAQVVDGDPDDLRRPVWTKRRIVPQELVRHLLWTEASVHQATHIPALIHRHRVTPGVPVAARCDICLERTHTAVRSRLRSRPLEASRWRIGVRVRDGKQSCDRQDGGTNYRNLSRRANSVETTSLGRPDDASTHCHSMAP